MLTSRSRSSVLPEGSERRVNHQDPAGRIPFGSLLMKSKLPKDIAIGLTGRTFPTAMEQGVGAIAKICEQIDHILEVVRAFIERCTPDPQRYNDQSESE